MTHNEAIKTLKTGNEELAWIVAQQDDGLLPSVTKDQWLAFAYRCSEVSKQTSAAHDSSFCHD